MLLFDNYLKDKNRNTHRKTGRLEREYEQTTSNETVYTRSYDQRDK